MPRKDFTTDCLHIFIGISMKYSTRHVYLHDLYWYTTSMYHLFIPGHGLRQKLKDKIVVTIGLQEHMWVSRVSRRCTDGLKLVYGMYHGTMVCIIIEKEHEPGKAFGQQRQVAWQGRTLDTGRSRVGCGSSLHGRGGKDPEGPIPPPAKNCSNSRRT